MLRSALILATTFLTILSQVQPAMSQDSDTLIGLMNAMTRQMLPLSEAETDSGEDLRTSYRLTDSPTFFDDGTIGFDLASDDANAKVLSVERKHNWQPTRYGRYDIWVYYQSTGKCQIDLDFGVTTFGMAAEGTKNRTVARKLGSTYLTEEKKSMSVTMAAKDKGNVELHSLVLVPTCENKEADLQFQLGRPALLHSNSATVVGKTLRYEPKPEKNTLGYWANANDKAFWDFQITTDKTNNSSEASSQTYEVEILQGCGKDNGGSKVLLTLLPLTTETEDEASEDRQQTIDFTVVDTGHWQNFQPRTVGSFKLVPGRYRLLVSPQSKAKVAVMDLRQITLKPQSTDQ